MLCDLNETDFRTTSTFQVVFIEIIYELPLENWKNLFNYLFIYLFMKLFNIVLFNEYERVIFYPIIYFKKIEF